METFCKVGKLVELIIFDMDGLIFDSERLAYEVWQAVLGRHGHEINFEFYRKLIGSNEERIKTLCLEKYGKDFPFEELKKERYQEMDKLIKEKGLALKPGLLELLNFLKDKPVKKAVATSTNRERAYKLLNLHHLVPYFDIILCGDEITKSKPDPEIFLKVCEKLNCRPTKTMVLEDSIAGIIASYNGKMMPIMIPDMIEPNEEVKDKTFKCFNNLLEVRDYLAENFFQA